MNVATDLNLELGCRRHLCDLKDRCFAQAPYEPALIEANRAAWIAELREKLTDYHPFPGEVINAPKADFHLRPGTVLTLADATVYNALLLYEVERIRHHLAWSATDHRCSSVLKDDQTSAKWFVEGPNVWNLFRDRSLAQLDSGQEFVVFADVSGYFENISISRLVSDLRAIGVGKGTLELLSKCLNRWAKPKDRGIPQGYRASFLLGEVYFDSIDRRLANSDLAFCRYVDDIRIFCPTREKAVEALRTLTVLLREKELNLQTAKSYIFKGDKARLKIDGIRPVIERQEAEHQLETKELFANPPEYVTLTMIKKLVQNRDEPLELKVVRRIFEEFAQELPHNFDKSRFHWCLNRLGAAGDEIAAHNRYRIYDLVLERPEELPDVLVYFSRLIRAPRLKRYGPLLAERLISLLTKDRMHTNNFDRFVYRLLKWIFDEKISSDCILKFCRKVHRTAGVDDYTRDYARAVLGEFGDLSDLDSLEADYGQVNREASKATIICALRRMVVDRRNSIYKRAQGDSRLIDFAIAWAQKKRR